ncbi:aminopeptidase [Leucothrix arctica]|uniref:Aminopeptidase n=1 Tax=Leucothrix arctica TaxID=1481894 RepID=A0A317CCH6_9GAMM|nr:aminopeptidase [Leucothrix arctica]PWQ96258.1 aminopeptidase [Leucothrix arctica]
MSKRLVKFIVGGGALLILLGLSACESVQFYSQAAIGHSKIMLGRTPITTVIEDPTTKPELARRLAIIQRARVFAVSELKLPDNGSYRQYVDLKRPAVVWNVVVTEAYSTKPMQHCFPVAGCVSYRGFFDKADAQAFADQLKSKGHDVVLSGASAYSTLGWFSDPVVSSMLNRSDLDLAGLIFHELAHQQVYQAGDTAFNESFATAVEFMGIESWAKTQASDSEALISKYQQTKQRNKAVVTLILKHRQLLAEAYKRTNTTDKDALAKVKKDGFDALRADYKLLRQQGGGSDGYDRWIAKPLNNASLVLFGDYHGWVSAFETLFERSGSDWLRFYEAVEALSKLSKEARTQQLKALRL